MCLNTLHNNISHKLFCDCAYKFLTNNNIVQFLYLAIFIFAYYKSSLKYEICNISRNNRKNNQLAERLIKRTI